MAAASHQRTSDHIAGIVRRIPRGQVLTLQALARDLKSPDRLVLTVLGSLSKGETDVPWHRVVMEGGALGRHTDRALHLARLRADGLAVAPAGIVQDMVRVAIRDVALLPERPTKVSDLTDEPPPTAETPKPLSRSRGRLGAPKSTI